MFQWEVFKRAMLLKSLIVYVFQITAVNFTYSFPNVFCLPDFDIEEIFLHIFQIPASKSQLGNYKTVKKQPLLKKKYSTMVIMVQSHPSDLPVMCRSMQIVRS